VGDAAHKPTHIAFAAESRAQVRAFHEAALAAGAKDNGAPGVRPIYHPHYCGAFVISPDGQTSRRSVTLRTPDAGHDGSTGRSPGPFYTIFRLEGSAGAGKSTASPFDLMGYFLIGLTHEQ